MHHQIRGRRVVYALLVATVTLLTLSACGSSGSSGDASTLLKQTFSGSHTVNSGNLSFSLTVNPSGSRILTGPITLSFGGPFQSNGHGKLPASSFNISVSALGRSGSIGILSTGTNGYVTLKGTSYQLPATTFQKLESSFAQIGASGGGSGGGTLSRLGINPLHWLVNPSVVGNESIGGTATTHIRAGVNVAALLTDFSTFLQKASTLGSVGATRLPGGISSATRTRIAGEVQNPTVDVWTGTSDKTIRRLAIQLTLPVTGKFSTALGGLQSAQIGVSLQYTSLNRPQTIVAPTTVRPFSEFTAQLQSFLASVRGVAGSVAGSAGAGSAGAGSTGAGSAGAATTAGGTTGASTQRYGQCIQSAAGDVSKMQQCASLLSGK